MGKMPRVKARKFKSATAKRSVLYMAAGASGIATIIGIGTVTAGNNMWGLDDTCTNEDLWRQVGLRPPCDPEQAPGSFELDASRITKNNVTGPDGTPDWFTASNALWGFAIVCAAAATAHFMLRRRGERLVGV